MNIKTVKIIKRSPARDQQCTSTQRQHQEAKRVHIVPEEEEEEEEDSN